MCTSNRQHKHSMQKFVETDKLRRPTHGSGGSVLKDRRNYSCPVQHLKKTVHPAQGLLFKAADRARQETVLQQLLHLQLHLHMPFERQKYYTSVSIIHRDGKQHVCTSRRVSRMMRQRGSSQLTSKISFPVVMSASALFPFRLAQFALHLKLFERKTCLGYSDIVGAFALCANGHLGSMSRLVIRWVGSTSVLGGLRTGLFWLACRHGASGDGCPASSLVCLVKAG